ncbi:MAG: hypothetical protein C0469_04900 [Cyanobacteria bacterium DS2.3.42]|nr:hypothetical protein [Cyanobacteria bacterium DS2.3.42]
MPDNKKPKVQEPMWPSLIAMVAAGVLHAALPAHLALGPRWAVLGIVVSLLLPGEVFHAMGKHRMCRVLGYIGISVVTIAMIGSVLLLLRAIPNHDVKPLQLLHSATALCVTNVLVFAAWYWRLDAGGPHKRNMRNEHTHGAFLFPQMTIDGPTDDPDDQKNWQPLFVDYLFLAFNTSTALSPTDVPVLSRWAKVLMMVQASISLTVVGLLAARAVNIL